MKAAIRCQSLDMAGLARAEKHGKRQDWIGQQRRVRDRDPLTVGGLNLADAYADHIAGARQNKGAKKPVLHFLVKFPRDVLSDTDAPTPFASRSREEREKLMLRQAVQFINQSHGGQAVFAARLDLDEDGETVVDVFACPRYLKESRTGREPTSWTSATRFGEALARKHQEHIRERLKDADTAKLITSPRAVGMALQEEFAEFFQRENGAHLSRTLKNSRGKDRLEVEEWKLRETQSQAREIINTAAAIGAETEARREKFQSSANNWIERNKADLARMKKEIAAEKAEVHGMRERLRDLLDQAEAFLRRPDLPGLARKAGAALMKSAGREFPEETARGHGGGSAVLSAIMSDTKKRAAARKSAPEDPRPESSDGPGF